MRFPIVEDRSPFLSAFAEIIGRYAGHNAWPTALIELEQFSVRPNIGLIVCDENGQVADEIDAQFSGFCCKFVPRCLEAFLLPPVS